MIGSLTLILDWLAHVLVDARYAFLLWPCPSPPQTIDSWVRQGIGSPGWQLQITLTVISNFRIIVERQIL